MKGIWKYRQWLPSIEDHSRIMLGEGDTPLIASRVLGGMLGLNKLYFKLENISPTGSYKDRFAAVAISGLLGKSIESCFATSSGNTGASLAAYCAAARIKCFVMVVDGAPIGKLEQMLSYGANIIMVRGFGKDLQVTSELMRLYAAVANDLGSPVQISAYKYSPLGMSGVETIGYEIASSIQDEEVHVFSPAGGGGLTLALARGFKNWQMNKKGYIMPKIHCVQPEGNDTISTALRNGNDSSTALAESTTAISGLQVPNVLDGNEAIQACRGCGGTGFTVTDNAIYKAQRLLSSMEGIFCEPAGATSFAGLMEAVKNGEVKKNEQVICVVTGSGFKDPGSMSEMASRLKYNYFETIDETFEYIHSSV